MAFLYSNLFPYKTIRHEQTIAIDFALDAFLTKKKRFVIIEAGTGVGKSAIGFTIARYINSLNSEPIDFTPGGYFLTTQKILQQQYLADFQKYGMKSLKSSSNYLCAAMRGTTCAQGQRALLSSKAEAFNQNCKWKCVYKTAKREFLETNLSVTNFPYFLAETNYSGQLKPRELLVIDECHNTEAQLSSFVEVSISERFAKSVLKLEMPEIKTMKQGIKWIREVYKPKFLSHYKHVKQMLDKYSDLKSKLKEFHTLMKQYEVLDKHECKLLRFLDVYNEDNWVMNVVTSDKMGLRKMEFKPIDVSPWSESHLFKNGEKVLMMSATILNKGAFCQSLGIDINDCEFISIDSPFPDKNKPIIFAGIGSMAQSKIDQSLPKLKDAVVAIMKNHSKEKGIIHCHTYKIANYLKRNIRSKRILIHNSENRDKILWRHINSPEPTVLLSPSMSEGVDLKDDAGRFQVICKIPYPYLGDKLVRKRMHKWKWWYPLQTAMTVVQAYGRSVRSVDDWAVTYILDADWERFYNKNKSMLPAGFKRCLK